jgi:N-carbamoylputrescine amidase
MIANKLIWGFRMKITVCQLDPRESQIDTYLSSLKEHIASEKSEFVLLPEMSFSEWLAADKNPNPDLWEQAIERHNKYIT